MAARRLDRKPHRSVHAVLLAAIAGLFAIQPFSSSPRAQSTSQAPPELVLQTGHTGSVNAIALSPDGRFLVSGSADFTLKIWDIATGSVLRTLYGHSRPVLAAAVSRDGRVIASAGEDATVRVWDVGTGAARTFGAHTTAVKALAFTGDSRQLVSLGAAEIKTWDLGSGRLLRESVLIQEKDRLLTTAIDQSAVALTSDGRLAAVGGGLDYRGGVFGFGSGLRAKPIRIVDTTTGRDIESMKLDGDIPMPTGLRFSPDGRMLAAKAIDQNLRRLGSSSLLTVYDVATGRTLKALQSPDQLANGGFEFSPDSKVLASRLNLTIGQGVDQASVMAGYRGGSITFLDATTWQPVRELAKTGSDVIFDTANPLSVTPLTFSADGRLFAESYGEGVALFETSTGSRLRVLRTTEKTAAISSAPTNMPTQADLMRQAGLPFDPDELRAVTGAATGFGNRVLDELRSQLGGGRPPINFTPDGKQLSVVGSRTVWDTVAGMPRPARESATEQGVSLMTSDGRTAFSPDGKLSARGGIDMGQRGTTIVISEVATGRTVQTILLGKSSYQLPKELARRGESGVESPIPISRLAFNATGVVVQYCADGVGSGLFGGYGEDCHIKTFSPTTGKELRDIKGKAGDRRLSSFNKEAQTLSNTGRLVIDIELGNAKFSKSGGGGLRILGGFGGASAVVGRQPFTIVATAVENGRKLWEIKGENDFSESTPTYAFSPDDTVLAVRSQNNNRPVLDLYDAGSGRRIASVALAESTIANMVFSPDNRLLAITYDDESSILDANRAGKPRPKTESNAVLVYELANGRPRFELRHEGPVKGTTFSPDGRVIATVSQDRNEYLWDAQTGAKLATMVDLGQVGPANVTQDWLVVTPDGLFDGSPAAWQQIMWRFSQNTFDVGPVESFFNELYYPGLASEIFAGRRPRAPRDLQQIDRRQPRVTLSQPPATEINTREYTIRIDVAEAPPDASHGEGSGARDVRLFRNGTLVKVWPGDVLAGRASTTLEATLPLVSGQNSVTAYAFNRENVKSADVSTTVIGAAGLARKGTAYVLALGVNQYENPQYNLKFANADAIAFADEVKVQQEKLGRFDRVEVIELLDKEATKANLLLALRRLAGEAAAPADAPAALGKLMPSQPEDAVIVYFAGHGTANGARFYLVPHDLGYAGGRTNVDARAVDTILAHSVSDLELEAAVQGLDAQQIVMVIDACNSGQALEAEEKRRGPMNSKGLAQLAYEKGMYILTAAQSYQAALEASQLGHGYLTYTLVEEGLKKGMADRGQKDGQVSVREWFDYATERVPQMQQTGDGSRLLLDADSKITDQNAIRNLQSPRAFYRREVESFPVIIGKP